MAVVKTDGTANLRAEPHVYAEAGNTSPSGGGKDCGGTDSPQVTVVTRSNPGKTAPTSWADKHPPVQTYSDGV